MRHLALAALLSSLLIWSACSNTPPPKPRQEAKKAEPAPVKIQQFYATPGVVQRGDPSLICYGVEDARAVSIEPAVEQLKPALTRCFQVSPRVTTEYRLTAEGFDGKKVFSSLSIVVRQGEAPKKEKQNRLIQFFVAAEQDVRRGEPVTFCYGVSRAEAVRVEPEIMPLEPSERRCFNYAPERTTTFKLTATGPKGRTERQHVTVRVHE